MAEASPMDERSLHETFAKKTNGEVWSLLEKSDRSPVEDERMLLAAHASYYHWLHAGTHVHQQRAEWMVAHVYTVLGRGEPARYHARRCWSLTEMFREELKDFDAAYAHEALARAEALAGDEAEAARHYRLAEQRGVAILDEEDRHIFLSDLNRGPWFGIR